MIVIKLLRQENIKNAIRRMIKEDPHYFKDLFTEAVMGVPEEEFSHTDKKALKKLLRIATEK